MLISKESLTQQAKACSQQKKYEMTTKVLEKQLRRRFFQIIVRPFAAFLQHFCSHFNNFFAYLQQGFASWVYPYFAQVFDGWDIFIFNITQHTTIKLRKSKSFAFFEDGNLNFRNIFNELKATFLLLVSTVWF